MAFARANIKNFMMAQEELRIFKHFYFCATLQVAAEKRKSSRKQLSFTFYFCLFRLFIHLTRKKASEALYFRELACDYALGNSKITRNLNFYFVS